MDSLVSTEWLARELDQADLRLLDATWTMPSSGRDPRAEFGRAHIPGAQFFDIDGLSDPASELPHMLPPAADFGRAMEALGVGRDDRIVVYDNSPLKSATRAWFMLTHFGARRVAVLDGGLGKWTAEGRPTESGAARPPGPARFDAVAAADVVAKPALVNANGALALIDARGRGRFEGSEADPRAGIAPGHIPGARNLPFAELYRDDGTLKRDDEIERAFAAAGIDPRAPFVATCGSGITATSLMFAAHRLGGRGARLYDGSWSEWGADPSTPKALGPA